MSSKTRLTESQLNKWRTLVALAHLDGEACQRERDFILESLESRGIDDEQLAQIKSELETPHSPAELFELVTLPRDRGELFYLAKLMFFEDGEFCDVEKMYFEKFQAKQMQTIDLKAIKAQLGEIEAEEQGHLVGQPASAFSRFQAFLKRLIF